MSLQKLFRLKNLVIVAGVGLMIAGLQSTLPGQNGASVSNDEVAAKVPPEFKLLYSVGFPRAQEAAVWAGFPYDSISIEGTSCFGSCPVYKVTLYRNGSAELKIEPAGGPWHGRKGEFSGNVDIFEYGKMCYLLKQLRFEDFPAGFYANWTDAPTTIVKATEKGKTKSVSDYSGVGTIELWAIQKSIESIAQDIQWTAN